MGRKSGRLLGWDGMVTRRNYYRRIGEAHLREMRSRSAADGKAGGDRFCAVQQE